MPTFKCRDMDLECDFEAAADSEEELMSQIAEHAEEVHDLKPIPSDMMDRVHQVIAA